MKAGKVVSVVWTDAWNDIEGHSLDELKAAHGPLEVTSVGMVVLDDDVGLMLAACIDEEGEHKRTMFIPRGMIVSVKVLRG